MPSISIIVKGKVQGVFFRKSAREKAIAIGITGKIKNQPDESVYIIATGSQEQLHRFVEWCNEGPPRAIVSHIETKQEPLQNFTSFTIVHS